MKTIVFASSILFASPVVEAPQPVAVVVQPRYPRLHPLRKPHLIILPQPVTAPPVDKR